MPRLTLNLLGASEILLDGRPVKGLYAHAAGLLLYLATEAGRSHSRDALIELLWPDESVEFGRQNLRQAISRLRHAIGDRDNATPFLLTERGALSLNRAAEVWSDVHAFEAACRDARLDASPVLAAQGIGWLNHAIELYHGEFLSGFSLPQSSSYDEWLATQRERFHRQAISALERSCVHYEQAGQRDAAVAMAQRLVEIEPGQEKGHRLLMRLLAESDQGLAALAQYRACENYLWESLGVRPGRETVELYESLVARLDAGSGPDSALQPRRERRRVTVLQAGLTTSAELDPEDFLRWRNQLHAYSREIAARFDASLRSPDGIDLCFYFGYPQAAANDIERAVKAALALQSWAKGQLEPDGRVALGAGISGGAVVLMDSREPHLIGEACLRAARLRHLATAGTILLCEDSWTRVQQGYRCRRMIELEQSDHRPPYRLLGPKRSRTRTPASSPLIGRDDALTAIMDAWETASRGVGTVLVLDGVPGIGKSHLLRRVRGQIETDNGNGSVLQLRCLPGSEATVLEPFLRLLREYYGLSPEHAVARRQRKFNAAARRFGFNDDERRLLATMLDLTTSNVSVPLSASALQQTMTLLLRLLRNAAQDGLLLCVEDIQWMDPSSTELLRQLVGEIDRLPMLLLITAPEGFAAPWLSGRRAARLHLKPLTDRDATLLVETVSAGRLHPHLVKHIVQQAGGIPLFLQELASVLSEGSETAALPAFDQVPASLKDSLLARLDRLQEAGRMARLAAVVGREFDLTSLESLTRSSAEALSPLLARLIEAHIVEPVDAKASHYAFCHGLIHELAYDTLLRSERRELHGRLAEQLRQRAAGGEPIAPEVLARHYQAAELDEPAVRHYYLAGIRAFARHAFPECISHVRQALLLLPKLPAGPERDRMELRLRVAQGFPMLLLDNDRQSAHQNFERAESLVGSVKDPRLETAALRSLCSYLISRAGFDRCEPLAQRFVQLTETCGDLPAQADAHVMYGLSSLLQGKLRQALPLLERGLSLAASTSPEQAVRYGSDPTSIGLASLALCSWARGRADRVWTYVEQALAHARRSAHPVSFVATANMCLCALQLQGQDEAALALCEEVLALCRARDIDNWAHWAEMVRRRILIGRHPDRAHLAHVLQSREQMHCGEAGAIQPYLDVLAIECCLLLREFDQGQALIARVEANFVGRDAMLFYPDLLRLRGLLLLERDPLESIRDLRAAFSLAARQRTPGMQLRVALALAALPQKQHSAEGARLLRRTLASFHFSADSSDLQQARQLLGEPVAE